MSTDLLDQIESVAQAHGWRSGQAGDDPTALMLRREPYRILVQFGDRERTRIFDVHRWDVHSRLESTGRRHRADLETVIALLKKAP